MGVAANAVDEHRSFIPKHNHRKTNDELDTLVVTNEQWVCTSKIRESDSNSKQRQCCSMKQYSGGSIIKPKNNIVIA